MKFKSLVCTALAAACVCLVSNGQPVTAFVYQGQLVSGGAPANGSFDLQFALFDNATGGQLIAGPITNAATVVSNGLFIAQLDFGAAPFAGAPRWLQIAVRTNGNAGGFTALSPLQSIGAAPYAITAINLSGPLPATNLSGAVAVANLPAGVLLDLATNVTLSGTFSGNGAGLSNLPTASLPANLITNNQTNVALTGVFTGDGAGLTGLSASALAGTVALSQLPVGGGNGLLTNGASFVSLNGAFSGFFAGNGNGLDSLSAGTLVGTIPPGSLSGVYDKAVSLTNSNNVFSGSFSGNGAGLTNILSGSGNPVADIGSLNATNALLLADLNTTNTLLQAQITSSAAAVAASVAWVQSALQGQITANATNITASSNSIVNTFTPATGYAYCVANNTQLSFPSGYQGGPILLDTTVFNNGWNIAGNGACGPSHPGLYLIQYTAQILNTNVTDPDYVQVYVRESGSIGAPAHTSASLPLGSQATLSGSFMERFHLGDTITFMFATASGDSVLVGNVDAHGPGFSFTATRLSP